MGCARYLDRPGRRSVYGKDLGLGSLVLASRCEVSTDWLLERDVVEAEVPSPPDRPQPGGFPRAPTETPERRLSILSSVVGLRGLYCELSSL